MTTGILWHVKGDKYSNTKKKWSPYQNKQNKNKLKHMKFLMLSDTSFSLELVLRLLLFCVTVRRR